MQITIIPKWVPYLLLAGLLVVLTVLAGRYRPSNVRADDVTILNPARSFIVNNPPLTRFNDVAGFNDTLYVLMGDRSGQNKIMHIAASGEVLSNLPPDHVLFQMGDSSMLASAVLAPLSWLHFQPAWLLSRSFLQECNSLAQVHCYSHPKL